ncbi:alpha/beta hydrolase [Streptomyces sp. URMC 123]|uniref:alpha/beta hydrolase n=1 Tax=Streptomyces sp. URMC 123 TaxID=3423403 RepID=UPI003F1D1C5E
MARTRAGEPTVDFAALKALKPAEFETAANEYRTLSGMAGTAKDNIEQQIVATMRKSLEGDAAEAAFTQLRMLGQNFHYTQVECGVICTSLKALASSLEAAKKKLDAALQDAANEKFTVAADGSVHYPPGDKEVDGKIPPGGSVTGGAKVKRDTPAPINPAADAGDLAAALRRQSAAQDPNPHHGKALEIADRIAQAVADATEADELWAPKLRALKADDDLTVSAGDWVDVQKDTAGAREAAKDYLGAIKAPPAADGDPRVAAEWWKELSQDQKDAYVSLHPASIGALNGLPADVRDEANRVVFAEKRAEYQAQLAAIPPEPKNKLKRLGPDTYVYTDEWLKWKNEQKPKKEALESALAGMATIQNRFDSTGGKDSLPEAYLLGFDPSANNKDGRVIIANGNPDTADHTGIFVPGTKTVLGNIEDEMDKSDKLWAESSRLTPGKSVSTIMWFDYDAPRSAAPGDSGDIFPEARLDDYAAKGAPALRRFLDGSEAAHQTASGNSSHTTLIGHSYGSTLIGDTAKYRSPYADVWYSNPLPVDDVVAVGSPGMQAQRAADLGFDGKHTWAMGGGGDDTFVREGGRNVGLGGNRVIPTDPEFGANIMESDAASHGGFWERTGEAVSLKNQARVIAGRYDDVTLKREAP